jgi:uncharacterized protein DUF6152
MKNTTFKAWVTTAVASALLLGIAAVPAIAHHSFAMYDTSVRKTLTGRMIRFVIGANHSQFVMEVLNPDGTAVLDEKGKAVTWTIETTAATQLARQNITDKTFTYGTIFTITFSPLRDGRPGGAQQSSGLIMCGTKMPAGGCTEATGKKY